MLSPNHPDAENHAYCADCGGEFKIEQGHNEFYYNCDTCEKFISGAQYRAEWLAKVRAGNLTPDEEQYAKAMFDADEFYPADDTFYSYTAPD